MKIEASIAIDTSLSNNLKNKYINKNKNESLNCVITFKQTMFSSPYVNDEKQYNIFIHNLQTFPGLFYLISLFIMLLG